MYNLGKETFLNKPNRERRKKEREENVIGSLDVTNRWSPLSYTNQICIQSESMTTFNSSNKSQKVFFSLFCIRSCLLLSMFISYPIENLSIYIKICGNTLCWNPFLISSRTFYQNKHWVLYLFYLGQLKFHFIEDY